jgi:hypothetical protein
MPCTHTDQQLLGSQLASFWPPAPSQVTRNAKSTYLNLDETVSHLGMYAWSPRSTPEGLEDMSFSTYFFTAAASTACTHVGRCPTRGTKQNCMAHRPGSEPIQNVPDTHATQTFGSHGGHTMSASDGGDNEQCVDATHCTKTK